MATPMYNPQQGPNNATQPTRGVNKNPVNVRKTHNVFDMSYFNYKTQRFGIYEPFFVMEGVPSDSIPLHSEHTVRALPMSSQFLSNLTLNKDYFMVPMDAILPNTWKYIYQNPAQGDDVPDDAMCLFSMYDYDIMPVHLIQFIFNQFKTYFDFNDKSLLGTSDEILKTLLILEMLGSSGSLLNQLGYKISPVFYDASDAKVRYNFDEFFDKVCSYINYLEYYNVSDDGESSLTYDKDVFIEENIISNFVNFHTILSILRAQNSSEFSLDALKFDDEFYSWIKNLVCSVESNNPNKSSVINMSRILAYQLACSEFYVNQHVDYIHSAQLFRDNFKTLFYEFGDIESSEFDLNGISIEYDSFSKVYFDGIVSILNNRPSSIPRAYDLFSYLFQFRQALKYGDYFTDCRTRPFAVGVNDVPVIGDNVNAVDVTKSLVMQKYLNAVVKIGNNFVDYLKSIFGTLPLPDPNAPKFIAHQEFAIGSFEVSNTTSDDQGSIVTNLSQQDDNFSFQVDIDVPCVLIGISNFFAPRIYSQTRDRFFAHHDRFDMFNPMLQYIGDQELYVWEKDSNGSFDGDSAYGYHNRNQEYKQRYSVASGGFVTKLPSWIFIADGITRNTRALEFYKHQNPDSIRANDYEFDRFFNGLSGYSVANRFHFAVAYNNKCMATRPMDVNPNVI